MSHNDDQDATNKPSDIAADRLKRARRVARTLDSFDIQGLLTESLTNGGANPSGSANLAASSASAPERDEKRKVAKTMIEADVEFGDMALTELPEKQPPPASSQTPVPSASAPKRKVAKTMIEADLDFGAMALTDKQSSEKTPPPEAPQTPAPSASASKRKVAKTMIEADVEFGDMALTEKQPPGEPPSAPREMPENPVVKAGNVESGGSARIASGRRLSGQFVAKTQLDINLIIQTRSQFTARENQRLEQEISQRAPAKVVEPLETQKKVVRCPFVWSDESSKERFRVCTECQSTIYNFQGMDLPQAEALVFQRENRKKFELYKREDGKLMTSDCPVSRKHRHQLIGIVAAGLFLVICVGGLLLTMPPRPTASEDKPQDTAQDAVITKHASKHQAARAKSGSVNVDGNTFHYEAGTQIPSTSQTDSSSSQPQKSYSDSEEKGDFWEYPNGQPADNYRPGSNATGQ